MDRDTKILIVVLFVIGLVFGGGIGFVLAPTLQPKIVTEFPDTTKPYPQIIKQTGSWSGLATREELTQIERYIASKSSWGARLDNQEKFTVYRERYVTPEHHYVAKVTFLGNPVDPTVPDREKKLTFVFQYGSLEHIICDGQDIK